MFDLTVRYFGFLKHVPLLPHVFEAMLKLTTAITRKQVIDYMDEIESTVLSWDNTSIHPHQFGGIQFNVNNKEIGHLHGNGLLDIPFSRSMKEQLIAETNGRVQEHHIFKKSGWISLLIHTEDDKQLAIKLLMKSYKLPL